MIELLRKSWVALAVLVLALVAQIPHAAYVFDNLVGQDGTVLGLAYAIALEFAVLMFVIHGRNFESYLFAGASILVNLSYYSMHSVTVWGAGLSLPAWLVSLMLPVAIARYSHIVADAKDDMHEVMAVWVRAQGQWAKLGAWWRSEEVQPAPEPVQKGAPKVSEGAARMKELYEEGRGVTSAKALADAAGVGYETAKSWLRRNRIAA